MTSATKPLRRIAFIGSACFSHQHDGCRAQGKGRADVGGVQMTAIDAGTSVKRVCHEVWPEGPDARQRAFMAVLSDGAFSGI